MRTLEDVRVVRGRDPVLRQRSFHVLVNDRWESGVAHRVLFGEQERQELEKQSHVIRHEDKESNLWFISVFVHIKWVFVFLSHLVQLQHRLRLWSPSHVPHEELSDPAQIRRPGLLRRAGQRSEYKAVLLFWFFFLLLCWRRLNFLHTFWSICKNFWKS